MKTAKSSSVKGVQKLKVDQIPPRPAPEGDKAHPNHDDWRDLVWIYAILLFPCGGLLLGGGLLFLFIKWLIEWLAA